MCYDKPILYDETIRQARKSYKCYECGKEIIPEERYVCACGLWEEQFKTYRWCSKCEELKEKLLSVVDGYAFGDLLAMAEYYGIVSEEEPSELFKQKS